MIADRDDRLERMTVRLEGVTEACAKWKAACEGMLNAARPMKES
jgi:hypothetical protein